MGEIKFRMKSINKFFLVPFKLVDDFILDANEIQLKVILFLLRNFDEELTLSDLCVYLQKNRGDVETAIGFWMKKGLMSEKDGYIVFSEQYNMGEGHEKYVSRVKKENTQYLPEELNRRREQDKEAAHFLHCAENTLGRLLTLSDINRLLSFHDDLGLPWGVLAMLLEYCRQMDRRGTKYIEAVAETWSDLEIDSTEKADRYIALETKKKETEGKIRRLMGMGDRGLSTSEKKYIETWTKEYGYGMDMIRLAYDKMVDNTNKISFPYMNKILKSWHEMKIDKPEGIEADKKPAEEKDADWEKLRRISQEILRGERD